LSRWREGIHTHFPYRKHIRTINHFEDSRELPIGGDSHETSNFGVKYQNNCTITQHTFWEATTTAGKKRRSRIMIPNVKTIQIIARAYQYICTGEEPWIALGNFRNAWYGYAKDDRFALVKDPITEPEPNTRHTRRWGAFCAASVEFLCHCYSIPCPEWVHHPRYILTTPWWPEHAYNLSTRMQLMQITPAPFLQRHIFCGNRLYQNKYEMSTWAQEARARGITNPGEIFRYARQKEISIHGG